MATPQPIDHDLTLWVDRSDCSHRAADQCSVVFTSQPVLPNVGRLVQQIEAQELARNAAIAPRERFPQEYERILSHLIKPQVVALKIVAVDAVAGRAV